LARAAFFVRGLFGAGRGEEDADDEDVLQHVRDGEHADEEVLQEHVSINDLS
jgi:hypothetical protein